MGPQGAPTSTRDDRRTTDDTNPSRGTPPRARRYEPREPRRGEPECEGREDGKEGKRRHRGGSVRDRPAGGGERRRGHNTRRESGRRGRGPRAKRSAEENRTGPRRRPSLTVTGRAAYPATGPSRTLPPRLRARPEDSVQSHPSGSTGVRTWQRPAPALEDRPPPHRPDSTPSRARDTLLPPPRPTRHHIVETGTTSGRSEPRGQVTPSVPQDHGVTCDTNPDRVLRFTPGCHHGSAARWTPTVRPTPTTPGPGVLLTGTHD